MNIRSKDIIWTNHAREKMAYYGLSEKRILRVLRHPERTQQGIAEGTLASMQKAGSKKHPYEIWLMYQIVSEKKSKINFLNSYKIKIISAWKYPGASKKEDPLPIPEEILDELNL